MRGTLRGTQRPSDAVRGNQGEGREHLLMREAISMQLEAIRMQSEAIRVRVESTSCSA
jgi:hypothetical protein